MFRLIWDVCIPYIRKKRIRGYFVADFFMRFFILLQTALALPVFLNLMLTAYENTDFLQMALYAGTWFLLGILFIYGRYRFDIIVNGKFFYDTILKVRDECISSLYLATDIQIDKNYDANRYYTFLDSYVQDFTIILFQFDRMIAAGIMIVAIILWGSRVSMQMILLAFGGALLSIFVGRHESRLINKINQQLYELKSSLRGKLYQLFYGAEAYFTRGVYTKTGIEYEQRLNEYFDSSMKAENRKGRRDNLISWVDCVIFISIIFCAMLFHMEKDPATVITMIAVYETLKSYLNYLNTASMTVYEKQYIMEQYRDIIGRKKMPVERWQKECDEYVVKMRDINYIVGENEILSHVTMDVAENEKVALIGSNGAGKSSLLRVILQLITPTSGAVTVKENYAISYIPVDPQLFPVSIHENIRYAGEHITDQELREVDRAAELTRIQSVSLDGELKEDENSLSGGEAQRVSIARAIVNPLHIMIADEPTSNLDIETEQNVMKEILERSKTLIYTTHNPAMLTYADRVYLMEKGKIVEQGTYEAVSKTAGYQRWLKYVEGQHRIGENDK